tara:strand:- start:59 stop:727 length:669 start_codon:yes stop_codon:yes gene_type:complete
MKNSDNPFFPWLAEHYGWHASLDYFLVYVIVASVVLYFLYLSLGMFIEEELEHLREDESIAPLWKYHLKNSSRDCTAVFAHARGLIPRCACSVCKPMGILVDNRTSRKGRPSLFSAAFHTRTRYRKLGILALKVVMGVALSVCALEFLGIWEPLWWYLWGALMEFALFTAITAVVFLSLAISALPFLVIAIACSDNIDGHPHSRAGNWKKYDKYWPGPPFSR